MCFYIHGRAARCSLQYAYLCAYSGVYYQVIIRIAQHTLVGKTTWRLRTCCIKKEQ
jgi:hypothetical protein